MVERSNWFLTESTTIDVVKWLAKDYNWEETHCKSIPLQLYSVFVYNHVKCVQSMKCVLSMKCVQSIKGEQSISNHIMYMHATYEAFQLSRMSMANVDSQLVWDAARSENELCTKCLRAQDKYTNTACQNTI